MRREIPPRPHQIGCEVDDGHREQRVRCHRPVCCGGSCHNGHRVQSASLTVRGKSGTRVQTAYVKPQTLPIDPLAIQTQLKGDA
jgi:hypothetical protein